MAEDQGRQVASMLSDFGKKLSEMMGKGKEEARTMARVAQMGLEVMTLEGLHLELMVELGEAFYEASAKSGKAKAKVHAQLVALVARAREVEKRIAALKRAMKKPAGEAPARRGRPPKAKAGGKKKPTGGKPARRGRPPKAKAKGAAKKPARRGRPPKAAASAKATAAKKGPARRGRPPKAKAPAKVAPAPAPEAPAA